MRDEPVSTEPYKGVRDFYPVDWARLQDVFSRIRQMLVVYGYEEYQASPLERAELYEKKTSDEIVSTQTYTFIDRGDRAVTLRPEMTPTLARMIAGRQRELPYPVRWFSFPNVFRYERPQRGRLREHYQLNVDLVGMSGSEADTEVVALAARTLEAIGAQPDQFVIRVSSRTLLQAACDTLELSGDEAKDYAQLLDRMQKLPPEVFEEQRAPFRRAGMDPLELIISNDVRIAEARAEVDAVLENLASQGITNALFDPTIVRGFLYYTGIVFEVFDTNPENTRSLFGGGRFDGLVSMFGGEPVPAVGFGMGDVTLMDFCTTHHLLEGAPNGAPQVYIGVPEERDRPSALHAAETIRAQHISCIVASRTKALGDQIQEAVKRGIPYFFAYGATEVASGMVDLKTLATRESKKISLTEISRALT